MLERGKQELVFAHGFRRSEAMLYLGRAGSQGFKGNQSGQCRQAKCQGVMQRQSVG